MTRASNIVFPLEVDNILLDNDRFSGDLDEHLICDFGSGGRDLYRCHDRALRDELGYADYLGAVQRRRGEFADDPSLLQLAAFFLDYPFVELLSPRALEKIATLAPLGTEVILSDRNMVLQPRKVPQFGLWQASAGRVSIYMHKQFQLDGVRRQSPAGHYILVEDKPLLLAAMKREMGHRLTAILVRQGHHALEQAPAAGEPLPDLVVDQIDQLHSLTFGDLLPTAAAAQATTKEQP